ncbi:MAG: ribonuclease J [Caldiserica bacterium CG02_land_8_20_14_3_00_36_38]|nr:MAG: ribonuclease J [Caldiserica bacterium CG02_land_8_20_14_3_00_36_38]
MRELKIIPLGGIGEIGKNSTVFEIDGEMILVDAGFKFPSSDMPGVDFIIPDYSYVIKRKGNLKGLVLTHGHLDHIGAVRYLFEDVVPSIVVGSDLTLGLVKNLLLGKLRDSIDFREVKSGSIVSIGKFILEFIHVTHSIPASLGIAVTTSEGTVFYTGDYKIDPTPVNDLQTDISRLKLLKERGVIALFSDSTNADESGFTGSESSITKNLAKIFEQSTGRVITATFSTNIYRIQQFIDVSQKSGRKVIFDGRSLVESVKISHKLGYLKIPEGIEVDVSSISAIPKRQITLITTGTQGEPMSGLVRISNGMHDGINITKGDTVVISADPIPGNERVISNTVNKLFKLGAFVYYRKEDGIHVSGHCSQEDIRFMIDLVKPKYFVPIHGEYKHLIYAKKIAEEEGINVHNILLLENGMGVSISKGKMRKIPRIQSGEVIVEGNTKIPVKSEEEASFIAERREMAHKGMLTVVVILSRKAEILRPVHIETRGIVFPRGLEGEILKAVKEKVVESVRKYGKIKLQEELEHEIEKAVEKIFKQHLKKSPAVFATVLKEKKK